MKHEVDKEKIKLKKQENLQEINKVLEKLNIKTKDIPDDLFSIDEDFSLIIKKKIEKE